jgi:nucleoside-diphosphate-sugar epimerase
MRRYKQITVKGKSLFVGIDLHQLQWHVTIRTEDVELFSGSIPGNWEALRKLLDRYPGSVLHTVYEAGYFGFWLHDHLVEYGAQCVVTPPSLLPIEYGNKVKTDRRDSRKLAQLLAKGMLKRGIRKVILVSTVAAYGNAEWPITEKSRLGPDCPSEYARTKRAGETIAWELYKAKRLPLVVIYPGAVIGANDPKATGRYIRNIARGHLPAQIVTHSTFPFVHVKDVCEAILLALEKEGNVGEKYIVAKHNLTFGELNKMICGLAGSKPPLIKMPDPLALLTAYVLTGLANLIRKPPIWDMSIDQISLMEQGFRVNGSKAERELGLTYTRLRDGIEEAIISYRM